MRSEWVVGVLGFLLVLVPYLGIPETSKQVFISGAGVVLLVTSYMLARARFFRDTKLNDQERGADTFVETTPSMFR